MAKSVTAFSLLQPKINLNTMVRHFENRRKAKAYKDKQNDPSLNIYKKLKGHKNRTKKPYVVCSYMEWLNLY